MRLEVIKTGSLCKNLLYERPKASCYVDRQSILKDETFGFQAAVRIDPRDSDWVMKEDIIPRVKRGTGEIKIYFIGHVPCKMTGYNKIDEGYINNAAPGFYPDILYEIDDKPITVNSIHWNSFYFEFTPGDDTPAGDNRLEIGFYDQAGSELADFSVKIKVINERLLKQNIYFSQWLHADCISSYYNLTPLSDRHFEMLQKYIECAVKNGINTIYTPVFTPPLDTEVGGERPTVQLVDVEIKNGEYRFGFKNLKKFVGICQKAGIENFEISHLFTQWGAAHAPKIMIKTEEGYKKLFGWQTDAGGEEYTKFLDCFLPALKSFIEENKLSVFFHVSDEPNETQLEDYQTALNIMKKHLNGYKFIEALSHYEFYENGLVKTPVVSLNNINKFIDNNVKNLWAYYCCGQFYKVPNRFIAMPSARNRIIAACLYKYDIKGFLHWGFNFWFSQFSKRMVDPFIEPDGGMSFPAGDPFSVYPGPEGPLQSIRLRVFYHALQDLRAFSLLEQKAGRQRVLDIIEGEYKNLSFDNIPYDEDTVLRIRLKINEEIEKYL